MTGVYSTALLAAPFRAKIMSLSRDRTPHLYETLLHAPSLMSVFTQFVIKSVQEILSNMSCPEVHDDASLALRFIDTLEGHFGVASTKFADRVAAMHTGVRGADQEGNCCVCIGASCRTRMPCCQGLIHEGCLIECRLKGLTTCPYCRSVIN